jgi:hypothetical protein
MLPHQIKRRQGNTTESNRSSEGRAMMMLRLNDLKLHQKFGAKRNRPGSVTRDVMTLGHFQSIPNLTAAHEHRQKLTVSRLS